MYKLFAIASMILMTSCTDTSWGHLQAYGGEAHIECYSGTLKIFDSESTGKIANAEGSDGYEFVDKADHKLTQVSGNCIVKYKTY